MSVVCDVLVIGSGAAGMTAAITAKSLGLDVILTERDDKFGGTSALSGGMLWAPGNPIGARNGAQDSTEQAKRYLRHELGNRYDDAMIDAFLQGVPRMTSFLEERAGIAFVAPKWSPDYHPDAPGASSGGRPIRAAPVDGRILGERFADLKWPLPEMMLFGRMMIAGEDLPHFLNAGRSFRSALRVARVLATFGRDRLTHPRGMRLTNGNALIARLARALFDLDIPLWLSSPVERLIATDAGIAGAVVRRDGGSLAVHARRGVILATGGFSADPALRRQYLAHERGGHFSLAARENDGAGVRMALDAGGGLNENVQHPSAFVPLSRLPRPDGTTALFPHLLDRAKPGVIAVNWAGRRFVNEANSYHDFVPAMIGGGPGGSNEALLVCDHRALRRYGFGPVRPFPAPIGRWLDSGYLLRGDTPEALATQAGIDPIDFAAALKRFNADAARGEDPEFGKGSTDYNRFMGDPEHRPNACVAPLATPPFYGIRLIAGDLASMMGLTTNAVAQVLDAGKTPIPGLYAVGNDMMNVAAGAYPGPGVTLGPGMTFGFIAAEHLARAAPLTSEHAA